MMVLRMILAALASTLGSMLAALLTEKVLKALLIKGAEVLVKKTETEKDDEILEIMVEAWRSEPAKKE